uniref:Uncharacterized protein n=1 Tax=viral metagenome TaxID=1070528 RepID=A0A6C0D8N2_9ZZZZ
MNLAMTFIFLFFFTMIFLIYASVFVKPNTILDRFTQKLPIGSHFLIGLSIYITFLIFSGTYKEAVTKHSVETVKDTLLKTLEIVNENKTKCPKLISSFLFPWQKGDSETDEYLHFHKENHGGKDDRDDDLSVYYVCNYIFQIVGFYIQTAKTTNISDSRYLTFFSSFYRSPLLKKQWEKNSGNFGLQNRLLTAELFRICEENKTKWKNIDDVRLYYEEYIKTEKFIYILNAVDPTNLSQVDPTAIFSF